MNQGIPEGGRLPDTNRVYLFNLEDDDPEMWMSCPGTTPLSIPGVKPFTLEDYKDIPIVIDDGEPYEPPEPTRWERFKTKVYWKWFFFRDRLAHWISPESFDEDW